MDPMALAAAAASIATAAAASIAIAVTLEFFGQILRNYISSAVEKLRNRHDGRIEEKEDEELKLHVNDGDRWYPVPFLQPPITFDTVTMDPREKRLLMLDLASFIRRKDYYKRIGKPWKRGYLLYGPPGTGNYSSLIAAMANYLRFDVYNLELTYNSDVLRKMLAATRNRSILVIEDKKSTEKKSDGSKSEVTLWGLFNFIDGLWSSCGEERIIVVTTDSKERLDPSLLRPGRMDKQVHLC